MLAAGQAVYLLSTPLLSRLLTPADFGLFGIAYSFVMTASVVVCMNFEIAIPVPREDRRALHLLVGSLTIAAVVSAGAALVFMLLSHLDGLSFSRIGLAGVMLSALVISAQGGFQALQNWQVRRLDYHELGLSHIFINAGRALFQLGAALLGFGYLGLLAGELFGRLIANLRMGWKMRPDLKGFRDWHSWRETRAALRSQQHFLTVLLPAQLIDAVVPLIVIAAVGHFFGLTAAGQFFLMRRVLDIPIALIFRTVSDIFYGHISQLAHQGGAGIRAYLVQISIGIAALSLLVMTPLYLFGESLFALFLGEEWRMAGTLASVMAPAAAANLAVAPVTRIFAITRRLHARYVFTVINSLSVGALLLFVGYRGMTIVEFSIALSVATVASYAAYFVAALYAAGAIQSGAVKT